MLSRRRRSNTAKGPFLRIDTLNSRGESGPDCHRSVSGIPIPVSPWQGSRRTYATSCRAGVKRLGEPERQGSRSQRHRGNLRSIAHVANYFRRAVACVAHTSGCTLTFGQNRSSR